MSFTAELDKIFEDLRADLVNLVGDHHAVHATVDDAKASISNVVPVVTGEARKEEGVIPPDSGE